MVIFSKEHKEIVGSVQGAPFHVFFDEDGLAEVEDAVGNLLIEIRSVMFYQEQGSEQTTDGDLSKMGIFQLKKVAKERGIDIGDASKKTEIIAILQGGEA